MRIMTYAVRQALATANLQEESPTDDEDVLDLDHEAGSSQLPLSTSTLIACAASVPTSPTKLTPKKSDGHRAKRTKLQGSNGKVTESAKLDDELVDFMTEFELPPEMEKFWAQRKSLFWRFDEGIKMDQQSWYSVTPEAVARQIAARCRCGVIVDGFCGAGGNAIQFATTCDKVIAIDIDPNKIKLAKANAKVYGVADKIEFICTNFIEWIKQQEAGSAEVVFISPPWGGIDYLSLGKPYYSLSDLEPIDGRELFKLVRRLTPHIAFYLPRHMDMLELGSLCGPKEKIEVEEAWMSRKCKVLTAYFGKLVAS